MHMINNSEILETLKTELDALGERIGVQIRMQRSEIFEAMHQI